MAREEIILLFWDCPECGHAHIEGPTFRCPNCFWWRDRQVEFYEAPDSRVLTPEEVERYQRPNWICKACGAANPDNGEPVAQLLCGNCNQWQTNTLDLGQDAPDRLGGETVETQEGKWQDGFRIDPAAIGGSNGRDNGGRNRSSGRSGGPKKPVGWGKRAALAASGLAAAGMGWGLWGIVTPDYVDAEILSRTWTVSVEVQEKRPTTDGSWSLPSDAYNVSRSQRQRGTRQVQTGTRTESVEVSYQEQTGTKEECTTTSRGDGTGTRTCRDVPVYTTRYRTETKEVPVYRQEPVYDTWYDYTVDRWKPRNTVTNNGTGDAPRQPPAVTLVDDPYPQRARSPEETCRLGVRYDEGDAVKTDNWTIPCPQYDRLAVGEVATFERRGNRVTLAEDEVATDPARPEPARTAP